MPGLSDGIAVEFGQAIDKVVTAFQPEVLRQIDDSDVRRNGVLGQKLPALSMTET